MKTIPFSKLRLFNLIVFANTDGIAHSDVLKLVKDKYPSAFSAYRNLCGRTLHILGQTLIVDEFGQKTEGAGFTFMVCLNTTTYDLNQGALEMCMKHIPKIKALKVSQDLKGFLALDLNS